MHSRKKIASVAAGVALLGGIAAAVPAAAAPSGGDAGVRSTSRAMEDVAVRRSPSAASEAIGMIPKDGIVPKTSEYNVDGEIYVDCLNEQNNKWVPVNWNGANGFVAAGCTMIFP